MTLNNPNPVFKVMLFFDAETVKDTAIVTMEGEEDTAWYLFEWYLFE